MDAGTASVEKYKSVEPAYVDQVLCSNFWIGNGIEDGMERIIVPPGQTAR